MNVQQLQTAVGEKITSFGFFNTKKFYYCGMPSDNVFSVAMESGSGHQASGVNLFFNKEIKTFKLSNKKFRVISVKPEFLILETDV